MEHAKDLRSCPTSGLDSKHDDSSWPIGSETLLDTEEPRSTTTAAEMYDCGGRIRNLDNVLGARRYFWLLPLGAPGLACVLPPAEQRKLANRGYSVNTGKYDDISPAAMVHEMKAEEEDEKLLKLSTSPKKKKKVGKGKKKKKKRKNGDK